MKKIYFLFLALASSYSIKAQTDPDLFGQWFFHYYEINSNRTYVPDVLNNPFVYITFNDDANPGLPTATGDSSCNSYGLFYEVNNTNTSVNLTLDFQTLAACSGDTFDPTYLNILGNSSTNFFDYTVDTQAEILTMIDLLGVKLVYGRQVLSTKDNEAFSNRVKLYPNPVQKELFLTGVSTNTKTTYSIYNLVGNVIITERSLKQESLDVTKLKAGIYFIQIRQQGKTAIKKFVKI